MRVLYTVDNLVELFQVEERVIRQWVREELIPVVQHSPLRFDRIEIDGWIKDGNLDRYRFDTVRAENMKGVWTL